MTVVGLSQHDVNVLDKIKDPESDPSANILLDPSLPRDPQITDTSVYERVIQKEREIVLSMQQLELQMAGLRPKTAIEPVQEYRALLSKLEGFISEYPNYASARNNRVQALRRLYGDTLLLAEAPATSQRLVEHPDVAEMSLQAKVALEDIERSIVLLTPGTIYGAMSPQAAKTLSLAYTQRAAIYHMTAKLVPRFKVRVDEERRESNWSKLEFEEAASRDFALGGSTPKAPTTQVTMKFLKVGRVAIITHGRYAGKKVVIIQPVDSGNKAHPFGHALVAGIERYPSKITRRMSKTRQEKRNKIKPFVKLVNYNHLMPTRYTLELEGLKGVVSNDTFKEVTQREDAKKTVKKVLEERYTSGKNRWFFTPLRF
ncbi:Tetratricopeptide repeat protein 36 [Colletotrichum sp. SAR11_59]|nr:Tetratricopeptide repeat protein 36 [Colletotrichum sp. SAR11_59]